MKKIVLLITMVSATFLLAGCHAHHTGVHKKPHKNKVVVVKKVQPKKVVIIK